MVTSERRSGAEDRLHKAREERDQRAKQYGAASGSAKELAAFTELQAAEEQLSAREAWLEWAAQDY